MSIAAPQTLVEVIDETNVKREMRRNLFSYREKKKKLRKDEEFKKRRKKERDYDFDAPRKYERKYKKERRRRKEKRGRRRDRSRKRERRPKFDGKKHLSRSMKNYCGYHNLCFRCKEKGHQGNDGKCEEFKEMPKDWRKHPPPRGWREERRNKQKNKNDVPRKPKGHKHEKKNNSSKHRSYKGRNDRKRKIGYVDVHESESDATSESSTDYYRRPRSDSELSTTSHRLPSDSTSDDDGSNKSGSDVEVLAVNVNPFYPKQQRKADDDADMKEVEDKMRDVSVKTDVKKEKMIKRKPPVFSVRVSQGKRQVFVPRKPVVLQNNVDELDGNRNRNRKPSRIDDDGDSKMRSKEMRKKIRNRNKRLDKRDSRHRGLPKDNDESRRIEQRRRRFDPRNEETEVDSIVNLRRSVPTTELQSVGSVKPNVYMLPPDADPLYSVLDKNRQQGQVRNTETTDSIAQLNKQIQIMQIDSNTNTQQFEDSYNQSSTVGTNEIEQKMNDLDDYVLSARDSERNIQTRRQNALFMVPLTLHEYRGKPMIKYLDIPNTSPI